MGGGRKREQGLKRLLGGAVMKTNRLGNTDGAAFATDAPGRGTPCVVPLHPPPPVWSSWGSLLDGTSVTFRTIAAREPGKHWSQPSSA